MPVTSCPISSRVIKTPPNALSIVSYGAKANDAIDDFDAIKMCIAAAKEKGKAVYIPEGTFIYNGILTLDGVDMTGTGSKSILNCINIDEQCILLKGDGADLSKIKLTTVPVVKRLSTDESARVFVQGATNFTIKHVEIDGASSVGIFNTGKNGVISNNIVKNTLADGIHNTGGTENILIENNTCIDNGDDQIAVVSYEKNGVVSKNLTIRNNNVSGGHARGITISGGLNIKIENNKISDTISAGIFISSEGSYKTYAVTNLIVRNNTITRDTTSVASSEKGGIRLQATYMNPSIQNALFENNTITDSGDNGIMIVGSAKIFATFKNNKIVNPKGYGIYILKIVTGEITFSNNTVKGSIKDPFFNQAYLATITSDMVNSAPPDDGTNAIGEAIKGTPAIDGIVDTLWAGSTLLKMDVLGDGTTGTCRVAWDDNALYYLFEMKDSTPNALAVNENNDSIELWVDELNCKLGAMQPDDYQLRVDLKNAVSTSMVEPLDLNIVKSAVTTAQGSYIVEVAVPFRVITPKVGDVIGFNSTANDDSNADGKRDAYISWIDKNLPYWADTSVYGLVILK
ncbi:MAG TPA: sugar-binding protein [Clostridiaceae bacterium]